MFVKPRRLNLIYAPVIFGLISVFHLQPKYLPIAVAASPYSSKPTNIENIKSKLLDSLFIISYQNKRELGFVGDYSLSQSTKDEGYKSGLITSRFLLEQCFYESFESRKFRLEIELKGRSYKGTCWGWATEYVDMATVYTALEVPTLPLWDNYMPKIGGWLIAAYFVPGFGITFRETAVGILNKETFVLGVEKFSPEPTGSALLFNQTGSFVGILTAKGIGTVPKEYFKVHGAPLQCSPAGTTGSAITNCSTRNSTNESAQAGVWTIDETAMPVPSQTPMPSPSPTQTSDAFPLAESAYNSGIQAYNSFASIKQECLDAFRVSKPDQKKLMSYLNSKVICGSEDSTVDNLYKVLLGSRPVRSSIVDFATLANRLNAISDEIESSAAVVSEGTSMASEVLTLTSSFNLLDRYLQKMESGFSRVEKTIIQLPKKISDTLRLNSVFEDFEDYKSFYEDGRQELNSTIDEIKKLAYPDTNSIQETKFAIQSILSSLPSQAIFDRSINRTIDSIPSFYCKRGKDSRLPISGKCQSGYVKSTIKKY